MTRDLVAFGNWRYCLADPFDPLRSLNLTRTPGLAAPGDRGFRPAEFRLPRSNYKIVFHQYGPEMPNFDDVADMIDNAIVELDDEMQGHRGSDSIQKVRGWNLGTAHLSISNPNQYYGLDHQMLIRFLQGLWLSGGVYGFFQVHMDFWDDRLTSHARGSAILELAQKPK
ncbi:hypothetical protein ACLMJK_001700 [Lecanora helva]